MKTKTELAEDKIGGQHIAELSTYIINSARFYILVNLFIFAQVTMV